MKLASWITAPFAQPEAQGTRVPSVASVAPVAMGHTDSAMIFRAHLATLSDGPSLVNAFDRMVAAHPRIADQVIAAGGLGEISQGRAVRSIREYLVKRVAVAPQGL